RKLHSPRLFADRKGAAIQRFCLCILALLPVHRCQTTQRVCQIRMRMHRGHALTNAQRSLIERFRFKVFALEYIEACQITLWIRHAMMLWSHLLDAELERF